MTNQMPIDFEAIRSAMADLPNSPNVAPNESISLNAAYFPTGHRGVLDLKRQLVVGNRGMGKSFWTHALLNSEIRDRLASEYRQSELAVTEVVIGFNGSDRTDSVTPSVDEIKIAKSAGKSSDLIWRAVIIRATLGAPTSAPTLTALIEQLENSPEYYADLLTRKDDSLKKDGRHLLIVFDALDRLAQNWDEIRDLSRGLLIRVLGLQSFRRIHAKVFMRADQFTDEEGFKFPDSSKLRNDKVDLAWRSHELYGLLFFHLALAEKSRSTFSTLVSSVSGAKKSGHELGREQLSESDQAEIVNIMAGEFMGSHKKRGRLFSWVPLHLSDAANNCSPRTFITAWRSAANHQPLPHEKAVDHLGIAEGVRQASHARLAELREDFPWIRNALQPLKRRFVPIPQDELLSLWDDEATVGSIIKETDANSWLVPKDFLQEQGSRALLTLLVSIAVMEERANGKINVPDIFRVEAEILRRGGVSIPRKK